MTTDCLFALSNQFTNSHNLYRGMHGTPILYMNTTLDAMAQDYANYLAANGLFKHSGAVGYGENLAYIYSVGQVPDITVPQNCASYAASFVRMWYNEMQYYNFNQPGFSKGN